MDRQVIKLIEVSVNHGSTLLPFGLSFVEACPELAEAALCPIGQALRQTHD
jgi:hypothetical protein